MHGKLCVFVGAMIVASSVCSCARHSLENVTSTGEASYASSDFLVWQRFESESTLTYETVWLSIDNGAPKVMARQPGVYIATHGEKSSIWKIEVGPTDSILLVDDHCVRGLEKFNTILKRENWWLTEEQYKSCLTRSKSLDRLTCTDIAHGTVMESLAAPRIPDADGIMYDDYDVGVGIQGSLGAKIYVERCVMGSGVTSAHSNSDCSSAVYDLERGQVLSPVEALGTWLQDSAYAEQQKQVQHRLLTNMDDGCGREIPKDPAAFSLGMFWPEWRADRLYIGYLLEVPGPYVCSAFGWGSYTIAGTTHSAELPPLFMNEEHALPALIQQYWVAHPAGQARGWSRVQHHDPLLKSIFGTP